MVPGSSPAPANGGICFTAIMLSWNACKWAASCFKSWHSCMLNYLLQIIIVEYLWTSVSRARCLSGSDFRFLKTSRTTWRYNKRLLQAHFEKKFCFIYGNWVASKQWTSPPWLRVYENQTPLLHNNNILGHSFFVSICQGLPGRKVHHDKKNSGKNRRMGKKRPNTRVTLMYYLLDRSLRADETNLWLTEAGVNQSLVSSAHRLGVSQSRQFLRAKSPKLL